MRQTKELDAAAVAAAEEAHGYLGGLTARSAQRDSALLARYRQVLQELLRLALSEIAEALLNGDSATAQAILAVLQAYVEALLNSAIYLAHSAAWQDCLEEVRRLLGELSPDDMPQTSAQKPAQSGNLGRVLRRFFRDLRGEIPKRFRQAELLGESPQAAAASLSEDSIVGRALASAFGARLSTILVSEWSLAVNDSRSAALSATGRTQPEALVKFLYFDRAPCDGSCIRWATGGIDGKGIYPLSAAPRPVEDTHPNCRCVLAPWSEEAEFLLGLFEEPEEEYVIFLESLGGGFWESIDPRGFVSGLRALIDYLKKHKRKGQAIRELLRGAGADFLKTLKEAGSFDDPRVTGHAMGSLIPDILLAFVPVAREAKAAKAVAGAGRAARAARRGGRALEAVADLSGLAERAVSRRGGSAGHALGRAGEVRLAEWLQQSGRRILFDPRSRSMFRSGPDAITLRWRGSRCIFEFWDNKAWSESRTVSGSSALEQLALEPISKDELRIILYRSSLSPSDKARVERALRHDSYEVLRTVSSAGGQARPGPTLHRKGIGFQKVE